MAGLLEYTKNGQVTEPPLYRFMRGNVQSFLNSIPDPSKMTPEQQLAMGLNANPIMGLLGTTAYHGSPAIFDKFDINKVGTGQGAQAYGHGIYFAENPAVAKEYQKQLSGWQPGVQSAIKTAGGNIDDAIQKAAQNVEHYKGLIAQGNLGLGEERANSLLDISTKKLADLQAIKAGVPENTGALYKVDIPDEYIPKMLDWDKPIGKQSKEIRKAILNTKKDLTENNLADLGNNTSLLYGKDVTPEQFLNTWSSLLGKDNAGEELLKKYGVTGVKYLDEGSRAAGKGTRNFVVFDPTEVKILEKGLLK